MTHTLAATTASVALTLAVILAAIIMTACGMVAFAHAVHLDAANATIYTLAAVGAGNIASAIDRR